MRLFRIHWATIFEYCRKNLDRVEGFFQKKRSFDAQRTHYLELDFSASFTIISHTTYLFER